MTHLPTLIARHWRGLAELAAGWLAASLPTGLAIGHAISRHNPISEDESELAR